MTTELTRKQFDILEALATADKTFSQRDLETGLREQSLSLQASVREWFRSH